MRFKRHVHTGASRVGSREWPYGPLAKTSPLSRAPAARRGAARPTGTSCGGRHRQSHVRPLRGLAPVPRSHSPSPDTPTHPSTAQGVTAGDRRLGFVERPYGPLDKTSPPATAGLRCAQPEPLLAQCVSLTLPPTRAHVSGPVFRAIPGNVCPIPAPLSRKSLQISTSDPRLEQVHGQLRRTTPVPGPDCVAPLR